MFFEESQIDEILKCDLCIQRLDNPRLLPCGKTICSACFETVIKTKDKKENSFRCPSCQNVHKNAEFPLNESLKKLLEKKPVEVFRSGLIEEFKNNLSLIESNKLELEDLILNGVEKVKEHCIGLRLDVDLATESAISALTLKMQQHRDMLIKQIDEYETKTIAIARGETAVKGELQELIIAMDEFANEWRRHLIKLKIDEKSVAFSNVIALAMIHKVNRLKKRFTSFVCDKREIYFEKNKEPPAMGNIGLVNFKCLDSYDLKNFREINIKDIINGVNDVQVYPQDGGYFYLIYIDYDEKLTREVIDKNKNKISESKQYECVCKSFKKYKDSVYAYIDNKSGYYSDGLSVHYDYAISKLNLDMLNICRIDAGFSDYLRISANDSHFYNYNNKLLYIYSRDLASIKQVGQSDDPEGVFYLPQFLKQFECNKGKYYWLNETNLQILKEDTGELVRSVEVKADNFVIDSDDSVVLLNKETQRLNWFCENGTLIDQSNIKNYKYNLILSLTKDGEPVFYDTSNQKILFLD